MTLVRPEEVHSANSNSQEETVNIKAPKRVLHFSDGVLEEYDDDDIDSTDDANGTNSETRLVDPATLTWGPWFWYKAWRAGTVTLSALDVAGEALASFFGITTPKYYFEVEEYKRREELKKKEEEESRGWKPAEEETIISLKEVTTKQPKPEEV